MIFGVKTVFSLGERFVCGLGLSHLSFLLKQPESLLVTLFSNRCRIWSARRMASFSPQFLDEIRTRISVSSVVGRRVKLIRRGRE